MRQHFLFFLALFFGLHSTITAQTFHDELESVAADNHLIGMSVAVMCGGELSDIYHYGKSDLARSLPVTDSTVYRFASVSKTVTATALMQLYEQGLFDLDDDIGDYLGFEVYNPNYPDDAITFRMLLSHTSSLQDGSGYSTFLSASYNQTPPPAINELITPTGNFYTADMWRTERPGSYYMYSNLNFGVIATLIEKISGERFDIYVRESLFEPLEIAGSFNVNDIENINNVAVLYRYGEPQADNYQGVYPSPFNASQYTIGSNGLIFAPQGGLRISAFDLQKFMALHANYGTCNGVQLLDSTTVALMHEAQWTYNGSNGNNYYNLFNSWSLGFHLTTNTSGGDIVLSETPMTGHPGEAYGLISDMYFEKDKQFGLIFVTNGYYTGGYQWGNHSAFYIPEEEVFALIEDYHYGSCQPGSTPIEPAQTNSAQPPLFYQAGSHTLQLYTAEMAGAYLSIHSLTGRLLWQSEVKHQEIRLPYFPTGVYIVSLEKDGITFSMKIAVTGK